MKDCDNCNGSGEIYESCNCHSRPCPRCGDCGELGYDCPDCNGMGRVDEEEEEEG